MEAALENLQIEKYPAYKESGEEWIGEVPSHWEIKKLKHIFAEKKWKANPKLDCGSISFGKVVVKDDEKIPLSTKASYQEVLKGEFLINPLNLNYDLISLRIALSYIDVVVSSGYIVLNTIIAVDKDYFKYLLHRYDVAYMKLLGSGVRQTINFNHIANSLLVFPTNEEQTRIAQFLNRKTAQIDQAIAQKEKLIELLKERRQILIHNAVTRGLNANMKMKHSGVEWIGEIPEHWEVKRLKYVLTERNQRSSNGEEPLLMMSQTHGLVVRADFHEKAEVAKTTEGNKVVYPGDLVFNKLKAHLGVFFKSELDFQGIVSPDYAVYTSSNFIANVKYLEYLFRTPDYLAIFIKKTTGIVEGLMRLYTKDLFEIYVPVPSLDEQKQILQSIKDTDIKFGDLYYKSEQEIQKLKEYKATLINSVVTGKIKVV